MHSTNICVLHKYKMSLSYKKKPLQTGGEVHIKENKDHTVDFNCHCKSANYRLNNTLQTLEDAETILCKKIRKWILVEYSKQKCRCQTLDVTV